MKVPCHGCKDRVIGCHSSCEKYAEYDRENKQRREKIKKHYEASNFLAEQTLKTMRRNGKK